MSAMTVSPRFRVFDASRNLARPRHRPHSVASRMTIITHQLVSSLSTFDIIKNPRNHFSRRRDTSTQRWPTHTANISPRRMAGSSLSPCNYLRISTPSIRVLIVFCAQATCAWNPHFIHPSTCEDYPPWNIRWSLPLVGVARHRIVY